MRNYFTFLIVFVLLFQSCKSEESELTPKEARAIAKEAYIYGNPIVDNYRIMHAYYLDKNNAEYKAPFNQITNIPRVYTPEDKAVQTPNSDTPYSWLGMDLRTEPVVIIVPPIDEDRYYSIQLLDQYTYIFDYIGSRTTGNGGGTYLVAGPSWKGKIPKGIDKVFYSETELAVAVFRTQLFNNDDMKNVMDVQAGYQSQTLSTYLNEPAPKFVSNISFIDPLSADEVRKSIKFFEQLNFVLQFCPVNPVEEKLMERFAKIDIGAGKSFNIKKFSPKVRIAIRAGILDAWKEFKVVIERVKAFEITSDEIFGSRDFLKDNYMYRMVGCVLGVGGNAGEEAIYPAFYVDSDGNSLKGANKYTMHFSPEQMPPVNAFWSMTMYEMPSKLLIENSLNRYLLNSTTLDDYVKDKDGGFTLYFQNESPGKELETNWLPSPSGEFSVILRLYWPKEEALDGTWVVPKMEMKK